MRLHFQLSPNLQSVDFNYHHFLAGAVHRWLGPDNAYHDGLSLYSVGNLQGGFAVRGHATSSHGQGHGGALSFRSGARWHISAPDTDGGTEFLAQIANAALQNPSVCCGMEVVEISSENTPEFGAKRVFRAQSPIFIRGDKDGELDPHILFDNPQASAYLTQTLRHKLDKAGLNHLSESVTVRFDLSYPSPKTRLIRIKEGFDQNGNRKDFCKRASVCPVIIEGDAEAVRFAWNVGAGNLTGMGFGSLV